MLAALNEEEAPRKGFALFSLPEDDAGGRQRDSVMHLLEGAGAIEVQNMQALRLYSSYAYDSAYILLKE